MTKTWGYGLTDGQMAGRTAGWTEGQEQTSMSPTW